MPILKDIIWPAVHIALYFISINFITQNLFIWCITIMRLVIHKGNFIVPNDQQCIIINLWPRTLDAATD